MAHVARTDPPLRWKRLSARAWPLVVAAVAVLVATGSWWLLASSAAATAAGWRDLPEGRWVRSALGVVAVVALAPVLADGAPWMVPLGVAGALVFGAGLGASARSVPLPVLLAVVGAGVGGIYLGVPDTETALAVGAGLSAVLVPAVVNPRVATWLHAPSATGLAPVLAWLVVTGALWPRLVVGGAGVFLPLATLPGAVTWASRVAGRGRVVARLARRWPAVVLVVSACAVAVSRVGMVRSTVAAAMVVVVLVGLVQLLAFTWLASVPRPSER